MDKNRMKVKEKKIKLEYTGEHEGQKEQSEVEQMT